ncbi:MAG: hypothetical protein WC449_00880 [Candidatus Paceibacterota bacterium]
MQKKFIISAVAVVLGLLAIAITPLFAQTIENLTAEQKAIFLQVLADEIAIRKDMAGPQVAGAYATPDAAYVPQAKTLLFVKPRVLGVVALSGSLTSRCGDGICGSGEYYSNCPSDCGKGATLPGYGGNLTGGYNPTGNLNSGSLIQNPCNYNFQCEPLRGETTLNCASDCKTSAITYPGTVGTGATNLGGGLISGGANPCNYNNLCEPLRGETTLNCFSDCKSSSIGTVNNNPPYPGWLRCEVCGKWYNPTTGRCPEICNETASGSGEDYTKQSAPITLPPEVKEGKNILRGSVSEIVAGGEPGFIVYDPSQPQTRGSQIGGAGGVQIGGVQSGQTNVGFGSQAGGLPGSIRINVSGFVSASYDKTTKIFTATYEDPTLLPGKTRAYRAAIRVKSASLSGGYAYIEAQNEQYIYGQAKVFKAGECPCPETDEWVCYDVFSYNTTTKVVATSTAEFKNPCIAACEIGKVRKDNPATNYNFKKNGKCQTSDTIRGKDVTAPFKISTVGPAEVTEIKPGEMGYDQKQKRFRVKIAMKVEDFGSMQAIRLLSSPYQYNKTKNPTGALALGEAKNISASAPINSQVQIFDANKNIPGTWFIKPGDNQNQISFEAIISENGEHCFIARAYAMRDYKPGDQYLSNTAYAEQYLVNADNEVCVKVEGLAQQVTKDCKTINGKEICINVTNPCVGNNCINVGEDSVITATTSRPFEDLSIVQVASPEVTTLEAVNITTNSITLRGRLTKLGGSPPWGDDSRYAKRETYVSFGGSSIKETPSQKMATVGDFEYTVKELKPGTEYCYNAIAWLQKAGATTQPTEYGFIASGITLAKEKAAYGKSICVKTQFGDALEKAESSENPELELEKMGYKTNLDEFGVNWASAYKNVVRPFTITASFFSTSIKLDSDTMYGMMHKTDLEKESIAIPVVGFAFQRGSTAASGPYAGGAISLSGAPVQQSGKTYFVIAGKGIALGKDDYTFNFKMPDILAGMSFNYYPFAIYDGKIYSASMPAKISAAADKTYINPDINALENGELKRGWQKGYYKAELRGEVLKIGSGAQAASGVTVGFSIISSDDNLISKTHSGYVQGSKRFDYPGDLSYEYGQIRSGYTYCYKLAAGLSNSSMQYSAKEICFTAPVEDDWKLDVYTAPTSTAWKNQSEQSYSEICAKCANITTAPRPPNSSFTSSFGIRTAVCASDNKTYEKECFQYYCTKVGLRLKSYGACQTTPVVTIKTGTVASGILAYNKAIVARVNKIPGSATLSTSDTANANIKVFIQAVGGSAYIKTSGAFVVGLYETAKGRLGTIPPDKIKYSCGSERVGYSYKISAIGGNECDLIVNFEPIYMSSAVGKYYVRLESILWTQTENGATKVSSIVATSGDYFSTTPVDLIYRKGIAAGTGKQCVCTAQYQPVCAVPPGFTQPQIYPNLCYAQCDNATAKTEYQVIGGKCVYVNYNR